MVCITCSQVWLFECNCKATKCIARNKTSEKVANNDWLSTDDRIEVIASQVDSIWTIVSRIGFMVAIQFIHWLSTVF